MSDFFQYDVFISHSSKDKSIVIDLALRLKQSGLRVWYDEWEVQPGDIIGLKIEHGLEHSRTLLLCMSENAFTSNWVQLERHTVLFRDPTNSQRRFIPIRLDESPINDTLKQFAFIDWRKREESEYKKLLNICQKLPKIEIVEEHLQKQYKMKGHTSFIYDLSITSDGRRAVTGANDWTLRVWDLLSNKCISILKGHLGDVSSVSLSADGKKAISGSYDMSVCVWNLETRRMENFLGSHRSRVTNVKMTPNGNIAISRSVDGEMRIWDLKLNACTSIINVGGGKITPIVLSSDGRYAIIGKINSIEIWDLMNQNRIGVLTGHRSVITSLALSLDGNTLISGSDDMTVRIWNVSSQRCITSLERHTGRILSVAIDENASTIVSSGIDGRIAVWDIKSFECIYELTESIWKPQLVALTSDIKQVIFTSADRKLTTWELTGLKQEAAKEQSLYTNAKVLLVGDSGVGKTGIALRLTRNRFEPTVSTDAHWVTQLNLPLDTSTDEIDREIWLWDFAGQADYRLIHQLFMDETALAVLVFNPQSENPFDGLGQWDRDLKKASRIYYTKILVAGRCDRGGLMVSRDSINQFKMENGFSEYVETSALTGFGCDKLRESITKNIKWEEIPWTASPRIFRLLKEELVKLRDEGKVLLRLSELKQQLELRLSEEIFNIEQLRASVGLLAGPGILWKLEFGDFILLQPERINSYAAAVIRSVRAHTEEIGCISEENVLTGKLDFQDMKRLDSSDEEIILRAMHQTFVDHGLCIRERTENGTLLVFPSYFKRERPMLEGHPAPIVTYKFNGASDEIYATLVVKLSYTISFEKDKLWRFAADFKTVHGQRLGFKMIKINEGNAELTVYCDVNISDDSQATFIRYVHEHLNSKATDIVRERHYICTKCGFPIENRKVIQERLERGLKDIICANCENRVILWDLIEEKFSSSLYKLQVNQLAEEARLAIDNESRELILIGHAYAIASEADQIFHQYAKSDHGINGHIEFKDIKGNLSGKKLYIQLNTEKTYVHKQIEEGKEIFIIKRKIDLEYWQNKNLPIMLVIRKSNGTIFWMNITNYLRQYELSEKKRNKIEFIGEPFTALSLLKYRDNILGYLYNYK